MRLTGNTGKLHIRLSGLGAGASDPAEIVFQPGSVGFLPDTLPGETRRLLFAAFQHESSSRAAALSRLVSITHSCLPPILPDKIEIRAEGFLNVPELNHLPGGFETIGSFLGLGARIFNLLKNASEHLCPVCSAKTPPPESAPRLEKPSLEDIRDQILLRFNDTHAVITACFHSAESARQALRSLPAGSLHAYVGDRRYEIEDLDDLQPAAGEPVEIVMDWCAAIPENSLRIEDALRQIVDSGAPAAGVRPASGGNMETIGPARIFHFGQACSLCGYRSKGLQEEHFLSVIRSASPEPADHPPAAAQNSAPGWQEELAAVRFCSMPATQIFESDLGTLETQLSECADRHPQLQPLLAILGFLCELGLAKYNLRRPCARLSSAERYKLAILKAILEAQPCDILVFGAPPITLHQTDLSQILRVFRGHVSSGGTILSFDSNPACRLLAENRAIPDIRREVCASRAEHVNRGCIVFEYSPPERERRCEFCFEAEALNCIGGRGGSGKSVMIFDSLYPLLAQVAHRKVSQYQAERDGNRLEVTARFERVLAVRSKAPGTNPASTVASVCGLFDAVRTLYSTLNISRMRGYSAGSFSPASGAGTNACPSCAGKRRIPAGNAGQWQACPECGSCRFKPEILEVKYKGLSIADLLDLRLSDAQALICNLPGCRSIFDSLLEFGLGYLKLGARSADLSQAELRRLNLATAMKGENHGTLYLIESPCAGLSYEETGNLLVILQRKIKAGDTIIAEENNLQFTCSAQRYCELQ